MRQRVPRWWLAGLVMGLALVGCAFGGGSTAGGPSGTATPAAPPPHALAWSQIDANNVPQIWASINDGAPTQITHVAPDGSQCNDQIIWSPPVFSPDLTHIVASLGSFNCGDGILSGPVSIITVAGGAIQTLPSTETVDLSLRTMGWENNTTIWFATYGGVYTDTIGGTPTQLSNSPSQLWDGVVRGTTLYWQQGVSTGPDGSGPNTTFSINRYNMSAQTALPGSISQGTLGGCQCSPGDVRGPGWDVSPDGAHIVYTVITPGPNAGPNQGGVASTQVFYANADGSNAQHIAQALVAHSITMLTISPNGQWIAFTEANPSPTTLTASVSTSGATSDPNFHGYSVDTFNYPVWKYDSSQFWAATLDDASAGNPPPAPALENFVRGGAATVGFSGGYNPWYTIGN